MAAAGEHRYEDSYFLKRDKASGDTSINENEKSAKRFRVAPSSLNSNEACTQPSKSLESDKGIKAAPKDEGGTVLGGCTIH